MTDTELDRLEWQVSRLERFMGKIDGKKADKPMICCNAMRIAIGKDMISVYENSYHWYDVLDVLISSVNCPFCNLSIDKIKG